MNFKRLNNIFGWAAFGVSFIVYLATFAKTASFWDCGEFISCAWELQVPHPPGPPVYLILGRVISMLSFGNLEMVAFWVNMLSVLSAAFTVLFSFWSITLLGKKIVDKDQSDESPNARNLAVMFAGLVGSFAIGFADSFWFNAVEAEVYAMSSLCTAAVVWLMLKWEARADEPDHLKWIILIAFVVGLSIGVHLLNLLAIPALAFVYYFKKFEFSWLGVLATFGIGVVILGGVQYGIIQFSIEYMWMFEKLLVGYDSIDGSGDTIGFGMPNGTGVVVSLILMTVALGFGIWYTQKNKHVLVNTGLLSFLAIVIGYSTYFAIVIRANANTPLNENDPSNVTSLLSYMKREQYGDRPLFSGPLYNAANSRAKPKPNNKLEDNIVMLREADWYPMSDGEYTLDDGSVMKVKKGRVISGAPKGKASRMDGGEVKVNASSIPFEYGLPTRYVKTGKKMAYDYNSKDIKLFPRMHSPSHYSDKDHVYGYKKYVKDLGNDLNNPTDDRPTNGEDLKFFFDYQLRHMYWRYFGWQFVGRESDMQDDGVESGLAFWNTASMPDEIRNNPGKNHYFALPLLLGILGLIWHFFSNKKDFSVILMLFFFTGIAINIYLNQTPSQPRERDYSYVGSFQTFGFWIGLGVLALWDLLRKILKDPAAYVAGGLSLLLVPGIMLWQNWDDHTRHLRYIAPDSARNLLESCKENAILFTNGDNDTFPLWYLQEVEDVRTDVRVVNLSLLNTDWYIAQMKKQSNLSPPLPITMPEKKYMGEGNAYKAFPRGQIVELPVNKQKIKDMGIVMPGMENKILDKVPWQVRTRGGKKNSYVLKQDMLIMNILQNVAESGWERPVYFSSTIPPSSYMNLTDFFQVEGLAYRVVPVQKPESSRYDPYQYGYVDKQQCYDHITKTFRYTNLNDPGLYLDEHIRRTIIGNMRSTIFRTANTYIEDSERFSNQAKRNENKIKQLSAEGAPQNVLDSLNQVVANKKAQSEEELKVGLELLDLMEEKIPAANIEMDPVFHLFIGNAYYRAGQEEKALSVYEGIHFRVVDMLQAKEDLGFRMKSIDCFRSALDLLSRYYEQIGEYEKAKATLEEYIQYSRDASGQQRLQQLDQRIQLEQQLQGGQKNELDLKPAQ